MNLRLLHQATRSLALIGSMTLIGSITLSGSALAGQSKRVADSKHNFSISSPGDIKTNNETRVCIFCHSSHNSSTEGPLWNHETTTPGKFKTYTRTTLQATAKQPTGATKLCLSCHDGTIAVGAIKGLGKPLPMANTSPGGSIPEGHKSNIGTNLSGTHPVSIEYGPQSALGTDHLRWPPLDPAREVGPDKNGEVQCTSCHDPHDDSKSERYPFWRKSSFEDVCLVCHKF